MSLAADPDVEPIRSGVGEPRCIRCGRPVGDDGYRIGGRITTPTDPVCGTCLPRFSGQLRAPRSSEVVRALVAGVVAAAAAGAAWYVAQGLTELLAAVVAVASGFVIGVVVVLAAGGRHSFVLSLLAVALVVVTMVLSANFVQRDQLQDGIDTLEPRWESMRAMAEEAVTVAAADEGAAAGGSSGTDSTTGGMIPEDAALDEDTVIGGIVVPAGSVIPPPEIVAVLPAPAFQMMSPEVMAVVWPDIPETARAEFPPELIAEVESLIASAEAAETSALESGTALDGLTLAEARAIYEESSYDIPEPVLRCAPPPDLSQPTAAAGLGFPDGVPVLLPLSDYYQQNERGDGLEVGAPSPWCFARENARTKPLEAASWAAAVVLAAWVPARRRLAAVVDGRRSRTRLERAS